VQFGLSFLKFYTTETEVSVDKNITSVKFPNTNSTDKPKVLILSNGIQKSKLNRIPNKSNQTDDELLDKLEDKEFRSKRTPIRKKFPAKTKVVNNLSKITSNTDSPRAKFFEKLNTPNQPIKRLVNFSKLVS